MYRPHDCPRCAALAAKNSDNAPKFDHTAFENAMRDLHQAGNAQPEIVQKKGVQSLIDETYRVLQHGVAAGIADNQIPYEMAQSLDHDTFVFSGMKVYNEVKEGSLHLRDEKGHVKSFQSFLNDVENIDKQYNQNYLNAEYNFAVHSAQMAAKWADFERDGDTYLLQYRTAQDGLVRAEHAMLDDTTLPMNDPFWDKYMPPIAWNCRCTTVQVNGGKYPESNSADAIEKGERATTQIGSDGKNKLEMFRFNSGKQKVVFPPNNAYMTSKCAACRLHNRTELAANIPVSEKCQTCTLINKNYEVKKKTAAAEDRKKHLDEMKPLLKKEVKKETGEKVINIGFTKKGNKHLYSDTFNNTKGLLDKTELKTLDAALIQSTFVKSADLSKKRKDNIKKFYYFKDKTRELYYNIAEEREKLNDGREKIHQYLYAVTKTIKK
ncbi:MAG: phage head morphogenesis protein [Prevotellaceae bacterium]|jgi:SPP1 gp7 family putative phage head morphogenesis protein|nr:phage head morphogenesis protein [Prevotellaceae bacterium]